MGPWKLYYDAWCFLYSYFLFIYLFNWTWISRLSFAHFAGDAHHVALSKGGLGECISCLCFPAYLILSLLCHCPDKVNGLQNTSLKKEGGSEESHCEGKVNVKVKVPHNYKVCKKNKIKKNFQERAQSMTFPLSTFLFLLDKWWHGHCLQDSSLHSDQVICTVQRWTGGRER